MIKLSNHELLKAWPFQEALKLVQGLGGFNNFRIPKKGFALFETGYGPSGLPHIGTFGEVVRTTMVKNAFESLVDCKAKLITFSDDLDGLRKIPENVPNKNMLKEFIELDKKKGVIHCSANSTIENILNQTLSKGWFLKVTPGSKFISVGGLIASDVHGKNHHKDGTFCNHLLEIEILLNKIKQINNET